MELYVSPTEIDGTKSIVLRRAFAASPEELWEVVSTPGGFAVWFPSPDVQMDAGVGGQIVLAGDPHAEVLIETIDEWDPPRTIGFGWGGDHLRLTVDTDAKGSTLLIVNRLLDPNSAALNAAGWHSCTDAIEAHFGGEHADADWHEYFAAYKEAGLAGGTEPPLLSA